MPFYDYRCDNCHAELTIRQGMKDPAIEVCPECGKPMLHKIMAPTIFSIRGQQCSCNPTGTSSDCAPSPCCANCPHRQ